MSGGWFDRSAVRDTIAAFPLPPVCTTAGAPVRGTSPFRGTSRCAPGAFSLTALISESPRA